MISIAIIDTIGLTYDGSTLQKRGLGGSESAVILMSRELAALGFDVTVINNCIDKEAQPGVYDNVKYIDHSMVKDLVNPAFDVVISSRAVGPFVPEEYYPNFQWPMCPSIFKDIKHNAKLKIVWLHDTFCTGDFLLEWLVVNGHIDELFTLSDFHTAYIGTCDHGGKRMIEVLKRHMFMTRNGIVRYHDQVDITAKDPYLYVYNASVTKGMIPLVERVWPELKKRIPQAKLKIIGGYYRFRENLEPDEQEKKWRSLAESPELAAMDVEFTGIIKQSEIADILSKATFFIYPPAFPETFGISSLESLAYNTPLITGRFGALDETAVEMACYKIDYPIEPNSLFPAINIDSQVAQFVDLAVHASNDRYLLQQKQHYCNVIRDVCTWDTVALQWKQHIYKKLGAFLNRTEYERVSYINSRVREVFGRRFSNTEEVYLPRKRQQRIVVVTPMYNAENYIEKCIHSVITQDYDNWMMYIIDDASTDKSHEIAAKYQCDKIKVIRNDVNCGAVYNQVSTMAEYCYEEDIVMLLDGDDWLNNNNQIFHMYNNLYDGSVEFSYGSCWSLIDNIPLVAQEYPKQVRDARAYREHRFNWNMPYTHLRTFKAKLLSGLEDTMFKDEKGNWFKAGGDGSLFYALIERADPNKVKAVTDIVYMYNDLNPLNDYKINGDEQTRNANAILKQKAPQEKFSVVVPTMWRCLDIFESALNKLVTHNLIDDIIIINNEVQRTPDWEILQNTKIRVVNQTTNIGVNPAWNIGVLLAKNKKICISNDDIEVDMGVFDKIYDRITPENGPHGIIWGKAEYNQPPTTDGSINFIAWKPGDVIHCFGQFFFVHKDNWVRIPQELKIFFGDDWVFHTHLAQKKVPQLIYNINFNTRHASTGSSPDMVPLIDESYAREKPIFDKFWEENPLDLSWMNVGEQPKPEPKVETMKRILIAVPTNKYIEPETMKAIYDQEVPPGHTTEFQYFYGYQIDQIRNLIAEWAKHYDYLFAVDSDVSFEKDTLAKMLSYDLDIVSGLYIQRKAGQHILELYRNGTNVDYADIEGKGLVEVDSCGFGCVLVKGEVFRKMEYPHFHYKSALDHAFTVSEDTYFCHKAKELGYRIFADTSILCNHHGSTVFTVQPQPKKAVALINELEVKQFQNLFPKDHIKYLESMKLDGTRPRVIYDIGACVLHWTNEAKKFWPNAHYVAFDAMQESETFFKQAGVPYNIGVLSDTDNKEVKYWVSPNHPGGNSYYKENSEINPGADTYFTDDNARVLHAQTLDTVVKQKGFPLPDLIKIDVQGAELDVLKGAKETLQHCKDLIIELQHVEYNKGAPLKEDVVAYLESIGFQMKTGPFCNNGPDGDYHFIKA